MGVLGVLGLRFGKVVRIMLAGLLFRNLFTQDSTRAA